ncbi:unnamed protein product [Ixodes persulcatus]
MKRPNCISQNRQCRRRLWFTWPTMMMVEKIMAPMRMPKTRSMRKPPKKHSTVLGHEYHE